MNIKDCPCCGSIAIIIEIGNNHTKKRSVEIKCTNSMCRLKMINKAIKNDIEWLIITSVESWNKRVNNGKVK